MFKDILNSKEFFEELRVGNPNSYEVVREYCRLKFRTLYAKRRLSYLSEDLISGTIVKLFQTRCSDYDPRKGCFTTWLRTVAKNDAISTLRHESFICAEFDTQVKDIESIEDIEAIKKIEGKLFSEPEEKEDDSGASPLKRLIERALPSLSKDDQLILKLRFQHGLPFDLIADELGIKESAARMRVSRAVERLRNAIERLDNGESTQKINPSKRRDCDRTPPPPRKRPQTAPEV